MPKRDYSTWLTKQQAADAIGVSTKLVEQLAKGRKIQTAKWKRPEGGPRLSVYHPGDVARERTARNPDAEPFVLAPGQDAPTADDRGVAVAVRQPGAEQFLQALAAAVGGTSQNSQSHSVRTAERLFLTIPDAADYSGLPQSHIRGLMKTGALKAMKTGGGWRIRRADLEKL